MARSDQWAQRHHDLIYNDAFPVYRRPLMDDKVAKLTHIFMIKKVRFEPIHKSGFNRFECTRPLLERGILILEEQSIMKSNLIAIYGWRKGL